MEESNKRNEISQLGKYQLINKLTLTKKNCEGK